MTLERFKIQVVHAATVLGKQPAKLLSRDICLGDGFGGVRCSNPAVGNREATIRAESEWPHIYPSRRGPLTDERGNALLFDLYAVRAFAKVGNVLRFHLENPLTSLYGFHGRLIVRQARRPSLCAFDSDQRQAAIFAPFYTPTIKQLVSARSARTVLLGELANGKVAFRALGPVMIALRRHSILPEEEDHLVRQQA